MLSTVLFTDIVGSTAKAVELGDAGWRRVVEAHHALARRMLARFRGTEHDTAGDGFFATVDVGARAISCARAISDDIREPDLEIRAGVHTGECEQIDGKVGGIAVNIGARVAAQAGALLADTALGYVSRYATGRDYRTVLLTREAGSTFLLGELFADLDHEDPPIAEHCGSSCDASTSAPRGRSWRPTSSMRAAASPYSPSRTRVPLPSNSAGRSATASTAATTASSLARRTSARRRPPFPTSR